MRSWYDRWSAPVTFLAVGVVAWLSLNNASVADDAAAHVARLNDGDELTPTAIADGRRIDLIVKAMHAC